MSYLSMLLDTDTTIDKNSQPAIKKDYDTEIAENIKQSEELRRNINLHNGNNTAELLEMTLKCISLMTGDTVFYSQNIKKLNNRS